MVYDNCTSFDNCGYAHSIIMMPQSQIHSLLIHTKKFYYVALFGDSVTAKISMINLPKSSLLFLIR